MSEKYWILYVSFPLNAKTMIKDTKKVEKILGLEMCGGGSGFGVRDVEFYFEDRSGLQKATTILSGTTYQYEVSEFDKEK